ncbi:uncharacterized protein A4U43_C08F15210 [Asparagus officinalis]|nr:uncharacterized protein A4U43_C08F15210 [Asparagus officinalis]
MGRWPGRAERSAGWQRRAEGPRGWSLARRTEEGGVGWWREVMGRRAEQRLRVVWRSGGDLAMRPVAFGRWLEMLVATDWGFLSEAERRVGEEGGNGFVLGGGVRDHGVGRWVWVREEEK